MAIAEVFEDHLEEEEITELIEDEVSLTYYEQEPPAKKDSVPWSDSAGHIFPDDG